MLDPGKASQAQRPSKLTKTEACRTKILCTPKNVEKDNQNPKMRCPFNCDQ